MQLLGFDIEFLGGAGQEMVGQTRNVFTSFAHGGNVDTDDIQAVEEIFPELAILYPLFRSW